MYFQSIPLKQPVESNRQILLMRMVCMIQYWIVVSLKLKKFRKWVTSEVLPCIRKTGGYIATKMDDTPEEIMARALIVAQETLKRKEQRLIEAERKIKRCS